MSDRIRVIQCGLGPIGCKLTGDLIGREGFEIVGALDLDPAKVGQDLGVLAGLGAPLGIVVSDRTNSVLEGTPADAVVLATVSDLNLVRDQVLEIVGHGLNVVTTCEELAYPWRAHADQAREIDQAARRRRVSVLGTGINPGFLMDYLPAVVTGLCHEVRSVLVERFQDASFRRLPFQRKIGAGLLPDAFQERVREGALRHVGLTESMHLIASCLGWKLDRTEDIVEPVIATTDVQRNGLTIEAGKALGVLQTGRGFRGDQETITLVFRAAIAEEDPRDRIRIQGHPEIDLRIPGGVNGDIGTSAVTINAIRSVVRAAPGLRTMADIPLVSCR